METIERHVTLPTDPERAWELLTSPDELAAWLGVEPVFEPVPGATGTVRDWDGTTVRRLVVGEVEAGRRLTWHWWPEDDDGQRSQVSVTLEPTEGGTLVRVVEALAPAPTAPLGAQASAHAGEAWSHRLLHLEALLLVAAAVRG